jgi:hypothetical protein
LKNDVVGDVGMALRVLMGALGLLMLLVCANVANLVLVRAQARPQEFAIRAALGAGWGSIAWEQIAESLTLGLMGGTLGLGLARSRESGRVVCSPRAPKDVPFGVGDRHLCNFRAALTAPTARA